MQGYIEFKDFSRTCPTTKKLTVFKDCKIIKDQYRLKYQGRIQDLLIGGSNLQWGFDLLILPHYLLSFPNFSENSQCKRNNFVSKRGLGKPPSPHWIRHCIFQLIKFLTVQTVLTYLYIICFTFIWCSILLVQHMLHQIKEKQLYIFK